MNSRVKKASLLIVLLVIVAMMLTACQLNDTLEDKLTENDLVAKITYHVNGEGSKVGQNSTFKTADMYYQAGSKAFNIGVDECVEFNITRDNYTLAGWYYPATNEDGSIKYIDEENDIVELGDAFDFSTYVAKSGDVIDLYAKWFKDQGLVYVLVADDLDNNQLVYGENTYEEGDVLKNEEFYNGYINLPTEDPLNLNGDTRSGYTFVGYYEDAECRVPCSGRVDSTGEEEDVKIYAKYLPSGWTVIKNPSDFEKIFAVTDKEINGKYYIANDIDGKDEDAITIFAGTQFKATIKSNGFTVSNFKFTSDTLSPIKRETVSIFGDITSDAIIRDITFSNFNVSVISTKARFYAYFFASEIDKDATISNVFIDGGTMDATSSNWGNKSDWIGAGHDGITVNSENPPIVK